MRKFKPVKVSPQVLSRTAATMLPLYAKFLKSRMFADQWSKAVRETDLNTLNKLFRSVAPNAPIESLATNEIGFFVDLKYPKPQDHYTNGTTITPDQTQHNFSAIILRRISLAILPLYRAISRSKVLAGAIVNAIRFHDLLKLNQLIRLYIPTKYLIGVQIVPSGFSLAFKYPSSKFIYKNEFLYEVRVQ